MEQFERQEFFIISSKTKSVLSKNSDYFGKSIINIGDENNGLEFCNCLIGHSEHFQNNYEKRLKCWNLFNNNLNEEELNKSPLWCCNYVIGLNENFIRIDKQLTRVSSEEKEEASMLINSTRIESGHSILCQDGLEYAECAGEIRLKYLGKESNHALFEIVSINLQSSFFAFPDERFLKAWYRFNIDGKKLYKTNYWEMKGREERHKYLK